MDKPIRERTHQAWWARLIAWFWRRPDRTIPNLRALHDELSRDGPPLPQPTQEVVGQPSIEVEQPSMPVEEPQPQPEAVEPERVKRKYDTTNLYLRRDLADKAIRVLDRFEKLSPRRHEDRAYDANEIEILENLWGCDFLLWDLDLIQRLEGGDRWTALDPKGVEDEMAEAVWPMDFAIAQDYDTHVTLMRVVSAKPSELRGRVRQVYPKMARVYYGQFGDSGTWNTHIAYLGLAGKRWVVVDENIRYHQSRIGFRNWAHAIASRVSSVALTERYEWHVAFGTIPGGPRLLLPTNPGGCLQLFKNRDVAPGKARRDVLKHWVEEHWRDYEESGVAYVCHHLRGHTRFAWSGFDCELFVSAFDLEKNEYFKNQAKEWRAQRKHNRVRVHLKKKRM
jgi:hypothetical protein